MTSNPNPGHPTAPVGESEPPQPKRRKIRKGTLSCWECKRRKVRCTYASLADSICDGCRSRRTNCISQEFDDDGGTPPGVGQPGRQVTAVMGHDLQRSSVHKQHSTARPKRSLERAMTVTEASPALLLSTSTHNDHEAIYRALLELWPTDEELGIILSIPVRQYVLHHGVVCKPYSRFFSGGMYASPKAALQLPPIGSHPVLVARKLLLLASWLQGIPSGHSATTGSRPREEYYEYASRLVGTVSRLVTSDDELVSSIEGIECLMIESMYLNNGGLLRRAWFINRKAMTIAQMLGLHQGPSSSTSDFLDEAATRSRIDPDYMWLRLVLTDRYLSLMLGLPQGTLENVFATPKALSDCAGLERFERMLGVAAGLILQRNSVERLDLAYTQKIDKLLQEAATCMPPQWWADGSLCSSATNNVSEDFEGSLRLVNQIAYHHLLIQLHLPYMLLQPSDAKAGDYDCSKMAAAIASRAILAHFVAFRASETSTAYCRGIDFITFTASMTLCLAHIECRRRRDEADRSSASGSTAFRVLQHQRLGDRGMIERTLRIMDDMATRSKDVVAHKIVELLKPLLEIESESASGKEYHVVASSSSSSSSSFRADSTAATNPESQWTSERALGIASSVELSVQIPYFGTINIGHSRRVGTAAESHCAGSRSLAARYDSTEGTVHPEQYDPPLSRGHHGPGYAITAAQPTNPDWQTVPSFVDRFSRPPEPPAPTFANNGKDRLVLSTGVCTGETEDAHLVVPGLELELEDWALQGVDAAFFSSLM
ncbi:C6 zinc finger domain containing protein [Apiospora rasikravindrae]|uniref:C6 zinc finger domain containing protein n=1 Tax=Apiospora rasikravindrae TaxID=990691 RepID=A0ABR1RRW8_9PEZI